MKALVLRTSDKSLHVKDVPEPVPGPGEVLVQVHAIALNPVDALYSFEPIAKQPERVVGTDFAGIVVEAGPGLEHSAHEQTKCGTRVSGFLQGASSVNNRPGAFAEFVVVPYDLLWVVPEDISLASASAGSFMA
ncbi:chaperonin 10-like protein [Plectosphaerella plurivora]|uniref:Chaperonin 10-like protein n=1 Tax=Plectosphaerella plurivora TaxID=936078 RepID=A0A9P8VCF0_9PEZI|nr:chaperonin 10-like protein [Plectosphaerella plurivora]